MGKYVLLFDFDPTVISLVADLNESFSAVFPSLRTDDLSELLIAANAGYSYQWNKVPKVWDCNGKGRDFLRFEPWYRTE